MKPTKIKALVTLSVPGVQGAFITPGEHGKDHPYFKFLSAEAKEGRNTVKVMESEIEAVKKETVTVPTATVTPKSAPKKRMKRK